MMPLDQLMAQRRPGIPDPLAPPPNPMATIGEDLDQRLADLMNSEQQAMPKPIQRQSQGLSSLLSPYQMAVQGAPSDVTTGGGDFQSQIMQLAQQNQGGGGGMGGLGGGGGYQFGNAFAPKQDLVTRQGVTLQRSAMSNLLSMGPLGKRILSKIGGGYRDLAAQARAYQAYQNGTGNMAARPGHSYHNYGLAFDLASQIGKPLRQALLRAGWRNDVPGEWWHWSIGNAPWGGN